MKIVFFPGFGESERDDNGKSPWILPSASDFLAVHVGLVLDWDQQDLKGEKFPPRALEPAEFKRGRNSPKRSGAGRI